MASAFCPSLDGAITVFCDMNYVQIIFERRIIIMSNASRYKALFNVRIIRDEVLESSTSPVGNLRFRHGTSGTPLTCVIIYKNGNKQCCYVVLGRRVCERLTEDANLKCKAIAIINQQKVYVEHLRCNYTHKPLFSLLMNGYSEGEMGWLYDFNNFLFLKIEFSLMISNFFSNFILVLSFLFVYLLFWFFFCLHV